MATSDVSAVVERLAGVPGAVDGAKFKLRLLLQGLCHWVSVDNAASQARGFCLRGDLWPTAPNIRSLHTSGDRGIGARLYALKNDQPEFTY